MLIYKFHICRAAGCSHEALAFRKFLVKFLSFIDRCDFCAFSNFNNIIEASFLNSFLQLFKSSRELAFDSRSNHGNDFLAALEHLEDREKTGTLYNSAERTGTYALAASYALIVLNLNKAFLVLRNGIDRTCFLTWDMNVDNSMERTYFHALSASDAPVLLDMCLTIDEYNRILRTVGHTGTSETATAAIADPVLRFRTSRAAGGDGRQERERRSILFHDFLHIERKRFLLIIIALDIDACNGHIL